jgi:hypothetical protein
MHEAEPKAREAWNPLRVPNEKGGELSGLTASSRFMNAIV